MASEDWAIVAGIRRYPQLGDLDGPENDASAMRRWLLDPQGGDVPVDHVTCILSSQFTPSQREPNQARILEAMDALVNLADANSRAGRGLRAGRRLYLYFSGHGFAPADRQTALLMANASRSALHHVFARAYAHWFFQAGIFDEVVLFMDCCQEQYSRVTPSPVHYAERTADGIERRKLFFGSGAPWRKASREKQIGGVARGVFTVALLEALQGSPQALSRKGEVTAQSLMEYLYERMPQLLSPEELADSEISHEPDIDFRPQKPDHQIVFCQPRSAAAPLAAPPAAAAFAAPATPTHQVEVRLRLPPSALGRQVAIKDERLALVAQDAPAASPWVIQLASGLYLCEAGDDIRKIFNVSPAAGGVDVAVG